MKTPTFKEQYQKIVSAYYKNKLTPFDNCACFIGNMLNQNVDWQYIRDYGPKGKSIISRSIRCLNIGASAIKFESGNLYTTEEILILENNFMKVLDSFSWSPPPEDNLFNAMESTLLLLRQIHESKGEIIEDYNFTKRELICN